jgi:hypothetical protein
MREVRQMRGLLALLSTDKDVVSPWIGSPTANRLGLHVGRIVLADAMDRVRWALHAPLPEDREWIAELRRDGVVAIPSFLEPGAFAELQAEVIGAIRDSSSASRRATTTKRGSGARSRSATASASTASTAAP